MLTGPLHEIYNAGHSWVLHMFGLGLPELVVLLLIALMVFGVGRVPEVGLAIGKAIRGFKKGMSEPDAIDVTPQKDENKKGEQSGL